MTKKTIGIILAIAAAAAVLCIAAAAVCRYAALSKAEQKLVAILEKRGWNAELQSGSMIGGALCFDEMKFVSGKDYIAFSKICVKDGFLSIASDSPDIAISVADVAGRVSQKALRQLMSGSASSDVPEHSVNKSSNKLMSMKVQAEIDNLRVYVGEPGKMVNIRADASHISLEHGEISANADFQMGVDISAAPVAFRNMPMFHANASVSLSSKNADIQISADPAFEIGMVHNDKTIDIAVGEAAVSMNDGQLAVRIGSILASVDNALETVSGVSVREVQAEFESLKPDRKSLKNIRIIEPACSFDVKKFVSSDIVSGNPILSGLVNFWSQDAGAILGEAPNKSVRKADVKKNAPVIRKNPISSQTLAKVRSIFDGFQKKVIALPAIDIQNGKMDIVDGEEHFLVDAVSFNTAELFKDSQNFKLEFLVRSARVGFVIDYDGDSPFPHFAFEVDNLDSADFLHLINMPVPENNAGQVSFAFDADMNEEQLHLSGSVAFSDFAFFHEKVSPQTVHDINASAKADVRYTFKDDELKMENLELKSGPLTIGGFIKVQAVRSNPVISFELETKDTACADIAAAIPPGLMPTIDGLVIDGGKFSSKLSGKIPWKYPLTSTLRESGFEDKCFPVSVGEHSPEALNNDNYTFTTDYTYFVDAITVGPGTSEYTTLDEIPPYVRAAMFLTEDKRFFEHGAIRIAFIERALRLNLNQRKYVYGGSTIAQQLTKNLFLSRNKNLSRKLEEAFIAWRLESVVTRSRIFELYLNIIEFGPDVYGITRAAKFYFNKLPKDLTPLEGAYLASLKVAPSKGGRYYKNGFAANGQWWHKRLRYIMRVLAENGYISAPDVIAAYNWTPEFYYPDPSQSSDFRNVWLKNYGEYLREQASKKDSSKKRR